MLKTYSNNNLKYFQLITGFGMFTMTKKDDLNLCKLILSKIKIEGGPVTVKIIIKRQVPDIQSEQLNPFLIKLRHLAMNQPGYITGETLKGIDPPGNTLVISTWESTEAWQQWLANPERVAIQAQIDVLIGEPTAFEVYSSG